MAAVFPFKAWHPSWKKVCQVSSLPYDVINTDEARQAAEGHPESFLHIIRPEIDLPEGTAFNDDQVYKKGAENLHQFLEDSILKQDPHDALFIYQLEWNGRTQTGVFGCVSVANYDEDIILKHELTRPAKEDDRTRHILEQQAHAEPVMLTCKDQSEVNNIIAAFYKNNQPLFDFTAPNGVTHRIWKMEDCESLVQAFAQLDHLYVADGHHRCKAASRAAHDLREKQHEKTENEAFNYFPAVIFPMSEMNVLAYNRIIFSIPDDFLEQVREQFTLKNEAGPKPAKKGDICFYLNGKWRQLSLPQADNPTVVEALDVYRLQHFLLEPLLGIKDPRNDENISFVGGIRGTDELEKRVDSSDAALAISMFPTSIEELVEVSDAGLLMPPKSTWFEPKLRSGLLVHTF
jgi:uncharacterized protein (DUF1015 family)